MESQINLPEKAALDEWYEHPVTEYYLEILKARVQECADNKVDVFYPGDPNRTQEDICFLRGGLEELSLHLACILEKDIQELDPEYSLPEIGNEE